MDVSRVVLPERTSSGGQITTFALRHERLGFADLPSKLHLRQAGTFARFTEDLEENGVVGGVDLLFHCVS
jgi:hypothetical protein